MKNQLIGLWLLDAEKTKEEKSLFTGSGCLVIIFKKNV